MMVMSHTKDVIRMRAVMVINKSTRIFDDASWSFNHLLKTH